MEYHKGFPSELGWYDVKVDGIDDRLLFRYCPSCDRLEWQDINGNKIPPEKVVWTGGPSRYP